MKHILLFAAIAVFALFGSRCGNPHDHEDDESNAAAGSYHVHADGTIHYDNPAGTQAGEAEEGEHTHEGEIPDHTVIVTRPEPFSFVIKAGGMILPDSKDIINVTSKASGIVRLTDHFLFPGMEVKKGVPLFVVSGDELAAGNTEVELLEATSDYARAQTLYERAERLIKEKLITMDHYLEARNSFEKTKIRYETLSAAYSETGNIVVSPANGFVNQVYITEGSKVSAGETLLSVIIEHNLVLRAEVPPSMIERLDEITAASFRMAYSDKLYKTELMNGRKISRARSTGGAGHYIPVFFSLSFVPEIVPGTYAEVYLRGKPSQNRIAVPNTSLLEEFGKYFVYVEEGDHQFVKRYVVKGLTDGERTEILSGLTENETVVATGAYAIKMSLMSTSAPDTHKH